MKDIILEYWVTKHTYTKIDEQRRELQDDRGPSEHSVLSKQCPNLDADWEAEN